jgi:hypothetical protein
VACSESVLALFRRLELMDTMSLERRFAGRVVAHLNLSRESRLYRFADTEVSSIPDGSAGSIRVTIWFTSIN